MLREFHLNWSFSLPRCRGQKASHRRRLRRRGAVCGVGAPLRCAEASPSSRLFASGSAALATPPRTLLQQPAGVSVTLFRKETGNVLAGGHMAGSALSVSRGILRAGALAASLLSAVLAASPALATTFTVTITAD